jgi:hypothetical protein
LEHSLRNRKRVGLAVKAVIAGLLLLWIVWKLIPSGENMVSFNYDDSKLTPPASTSGEELSLTEGMRPYAEDDTLILSADLGTQLFTIMDKRNGMVWSSSPDTSHDENINEVSKNIAASPFTITYTLKFKETVTTSLLNEKVSWKVYSIPGGLQVHYDVKNLEFSFIAEIVLQEGGIHVRIPEEGIKEYGKASITAINVFPMFAAAKQGDEGYMVIPDGSGALTYFNRPHKLYDNWGYAKWIYGPDPTFDPKNGPIIGERIAIPVFGMVKEGGAYVQTIIKGAEDARIIASPPGVFNLNYYRGGMEFHLRKAYNARLGKVGREVTRIEKTRIRDNREIRFDFIAEATASYSHLAASVREQLRKSWNSVLSEKDNSLLLRFFLGTESGKGGFSSNLEVMTTFAEAREIVEKYRQDGISNISIELKGWYKDGYYGDLPEKFPVEGELGGNKELINLLNWAAREKIRVSLEDNYLDIYDKEKGGVNLRSDAVRQPNGELFYYNPIDSTGWYRSWIKWHWLSPMVVDRDYREKGLETLRKMGASSVNLRFAGEMLFSDYNDKQALHRHQTLEYVNKWIQDIKTRLGSAGIYYGNGNNVKYADRILGIPLTTSADYMLDEQVPFLQMIYHGHKIYYSKAINRSNFPKRELLRAIEYGAIPSFELTYRPTTKLRYTNYDRLFSSHYEDWNLQVKEAYDMWHDTLSAISNKVITNHDKITADVYKVTYEDGTVIWINYGEKQFKDGGITVEPMNYSVRKGSAWR